MAIGRLQVSPSKRFGHPGRGKAATFTCVAVGNRLSCLGVSACNYNSSNKLTARSNATFTYDARGNRTSVTDALQDPPTTFLYDVMNRLTKIIQPGNATTQFAYDTRGRRTSVTDPNNKTTQ